MSLLIVESPAKAKKIQSFFKGDVTVRSSFGHINNLDTTKLEQMISNGFEPIYKNMSQLDNSNVSIKISLPNLYL